MLDLALQRTTQRGPAGKQNIANGQGRELQHEICFHRPSAGGARLRAGSESGLEQTLWKDCSQLCIPTLPTAASCKSWGWRPASSYPCLSSSLVWYAAQGGSFDLRGPRAGLGSLSLTCHLVTDMGGQRWVIFFIGCVHGLTFWVRRLCLLYSQQSQVDSKSAEVN